MSKYSQRVEALENNEKKKKAIFTVIIVLLVLLFFGGMVIGGKSILNTEPAYDPSADKATQPEILDISESAVIDNYADKIEAAVNPDKVRLSVYTDVEIPDDSIVVESGNESIVTQLKYIKPKALEEIKNYYKIFEGKFGDDFSAKVIPAAFTAKDIEKTECVRGRLDDKGELVDRDTLFYSINFPEAEFDDIESTVLFGSFGMGVSEQIRDTFTEDIKEIAGAESIKIGCKDFRITFETEQATGRIKNIWYIRGYSVTMSLTFKGDLAPLGIQTVSFDFYAKESHWYTWAGVSLSKHTLSMKKGKVEALEAKKTADDDVAVSWTSSNPELATVDEQGYVKGKAESSEPVIITATFDYRGSTYTDSCEVFVRKPVDKIKTTPKALEMKVADTAQLSAEVSPKKATIQDILWFTEDESIAAVDENGVVTAVRAGTTKVFAVAADGYCRSSCTVTVVQ